MLGSNEATGINEANPDISVIISTRNRSGSLQITMEHLVEADRDGIRAELVVVDNGGNDDTKDIVKSFQSEIMIRYLYEPTLGVSGKSHALNRALDEGGLGAIIAVLDDDMSPHRRWFKGVMEICRRWPNMDIFTGDTYIIWPFYDVPAWAAEPRIHGWMFSSFRPGDVDLQIRDGRWFSGNHFWFRSRVLHGGRRFKDIWLTEPDFQLNLIEQGVYGVASRDAVAGHRVQADLLQRDVALKRAEMTGCCRAWVRLHPYRRTVRQARLFREHPWLARLFCIFNYLRWRTMYHAFSLYSPSSSHFAQRLVAMERMTTALEYLRAARHAEEYAILGRI